MESCHIYVICDISSVVFLNVVRYLLLLMRLGKWGLAGQGVSKVLYPGLKSGVLIYFGVNLEWY